MAEPALHSQRPPKLLTTQPTCCALRTPPQQLVSAAPISTETRTFVVAAEKALSPYKSLDVHMETPASLRPNPGGSASSVTQRKAGGASCAPTSSRHTQEPRESAVAARASLRDRDSGSPHVMSQSIPAAFFLLNRLAAMCAEGSIIPGRSWPPGSGLRRHSEVGGSPTAAARRADRLLPKWGGRSVAPTAVAGCGGRAGREATQAAEGRNSPLS